MTKTRARNGQSIKVLPIDTIWPSPENDRLYRPVDPDTSSIQRLAESIQRHGVLEPVVITSDGYILSGHRRHAAAKLAGLTKVPCRVESFRRVTDLDRFTAKLAEYNRQRVKTLDEVLREEVVAADPDDAYRELQFHRKAESDKSGFGRLSKVVIDGPRQRKAISQAKDPMLNAILDILEVRKQFWPLSVRGVHYPLLNDPPLRHASKPDSTYRNDRKSYQDLCDLLTRARMTGVIPWEAIDDETRPIVLSLAFSSADEFARQELDRFLRGYWRNLQQSQPNHIEIVGEKLTVRSIVEPVAQEYCIPLTIGRGFCSSPPRYQMQQRFRKSGKEKLIVLILSDFDPSGEDIAHSFARSMRDDFGVDQLTAVKVALTSDQVRELKLPPQMKAKEGSSGYKKFTEKHGDDVFELEAVEPAALQSMLRDAIDTVIDRDAFNAELDAEKRDAAEIATIRRRAMLALGKRDSEEAAE